MTRLRRWLDRLFHRDHAHANGVCLPDGWDD